VYQSIWGLRFVAKNVGHLQSVECVTNTYVGDGFVEQAVAITVFGVLIVAFDEYALLGQRHFSQ
jgi:hypothetical protein